MDVKPFAGVCDIGDSEISYLEYRAAEDRQAVVFLHATGFTPWLWHPVARQLVDRCRVIAPYFCDHRQGEPEEGGISWTVLASDLAALCSALGITRAVFVGHSMGATVMTLAAADGKIEPLGMILIEPIFLPEFAYAMRPAVEAHPLASKSIRRRDFWNSPEEARTYLRSKKLFANWDSEMLDIYIERGMRPEEGGLRLACAPRREAALFLGSQSRNPWSDLPRISCPVLIVEGAESENRAFIDLVKAASFFPHASHILLPGAGHLVPMEMPEKVTGVVKDFLLSLE